MIRQIKGTQKLNHKRLRKRSKKYIKLGQQENKKKTLHQQLTLEWIYK